MKKFVSFVAAAALVAGMATSCQKHNTLTKAEQAEGWQLLFDGYSLSLTPRTSLKRSPLITARLILAAKSVLHTA